MHFYILNRKATSIVIILFAMVLGCCKKPDTSQVLDGEGEGVGEFDVLQHHGPVVAIGDLHGDYERYLEVLGKAGVVNREGTWSGENTLVVQVGDQLDRGDGERRILDHYLGLKTAAREAGGDVVFLSGNHEVMNTLLDLRYVTEGGYEEFADFTDAANQIAEIRDYPEDERGRVFAFRQTGPYAMRLSEFPVTQIVNDTIFVHGGVLRSHVAYGLKKLNLEVKNWYRNMEIDVPEIMNANSSPVWTRKYSTDPGRRECQELTEVLDILGLKRMVVAHTVQDNGISTACSDKVYRVDTGLARYYGGPVQALRISGEDVEILR